MNLLLKASDGATLDVVTLINGKLKYKTGQARPMFDGKRNVPQPPTDSQLFKLLTDWSNGYLSIIKE